MLSRLYLPLDSNNGICTIGHTHFVSMLEDGLHWWECVQKVKIVLVYAQSESNQRQLSKWLRPLSKVHANFGEAAGSLQRFFADHANFKVPPRAAKPAQNQPRDLAFFGSGRTSAGAGGGSRPGAFSSGGPDLLLSSLANVPSAADASGLPGCLADP